MKLLRLGLLLIVAVAAPLAVSGFWAAHTLNDSEGYAESMAVAWRDAGLQSELQQELTNAATEQVYDYFGATGPDQNFLADTAASLATSTIASNLASGQFALAWRGWHYQLHEDLALIVAGGTPQTTSVEGSVITVDIAPLADVILSGRIGAMIADALGDDLLTRTIDTGYDVEARLDLFGRLLSARWWAAGLALAAAAGAAWLWRPWLRGACAALAAAAAGCAAMGIWRLLGESGSADPDASRLGAAVSNALIGSWDVWLLTMSALLALAAGVLAALDRRSRAKVRGAEPSVV